MLLEPWANELATFDSYALELSYVENPPHWDQAVTIHVIVVGGQPPDVCPVVFTLSDQHGPVGDMATCVHLLSSQCTLQQAVAGALPQFYLDEVQVNDLDQPGNETAMSSTTVGLLHSRHVFVDWVHQGETADEEGDDVDLMQKDLFVLGASPVGTEEVVLMQRERSRSRNASGSNHAILPSRRGGASHDPVTPLAAVQAAQDFEWTVLFTDMTADVDTVFAAYTGPTTTQVQQVIGFPEAEIVQVHVVHSALQHFGEAIALVECAGDHILHTSESLILVDVLHSNSEVAGTTEGSVRIFHSCMIARRLQSFDYSPKDFQVHSDVSLSAPRVAQCIGVVA